MIILFTNDVVIYDASENISSDEPVNNFEFSVV